MTSLTYYPPLKVVPEDETILYTGRPDAIFLFPLTKQIRYTVPSLRKAIITKIDAVNTNNYQDSAFYFAILDSLQAFRYVFNNKRLLFKEHLSVNCWIPLEAGEGFGCGFNLTDTVEVAGDLHVTVSGLVY